MQGVMEWGKTGMPWVSLIDYNDDVCVLVSIVLIYAFIFLAMLFYSNYILCTIFKYLYKQQY